jgi:hypothetical protein
LLVGWVIYGLRYFQCLLEISVFIVTLSKVKFILGYFGVEFRELFVDSGRVEEVLAHVVAIGK